MTPTPTTATAIQKLRRMRVLFSPKMNSSMGCQKRIITHPAARRRYLRMSTTMKPLVARERHFSRAYAELRVAFAPPDGSEFARGLAMQTAATRRTGIAFLILVALLSIQGRA